MDVVSPRGKSETGPGRPGRRLGVAAFAAGALVAFGPGAASAADPLVEALALTHASGGVEAPDFTLAMPDGKQNLSLGSLRGKVVLLNFWATWCPPCREEMPSMERLHQEFRDQGLAVAAVDLQESPKQVARFMKDFRLSFPAVLDADGKVAARYQVRALPATFLVDRAGRVVAQALGARNWASPESKALIRSLLGAPGGRS